MNSQVSGVILAGGRATRMGGQDKGLLIIHNKPMVAHIATQIRPQCRQILINANRNQSEYEKYTQQVFSDELENFQGPLAGMLTAMHQIDTPWLITLPCDGPFVAPVYVSRMMHAAAKDNTKIAVATDGHRLQPVYALLHKELADSLTHFLHHGERKIDKWFGLHDYSEVNFSDYADMFLNINTPENLQHTQMQFETINQRMQSQ